MTLIKAIATNGDVHVLRGRTSIAVFQHEDDANLFVQAARDQSKAPRQDVGKGGPRPAEKWERRGTPFDPIPQFDRGSISHPICIACAQRHPPGMPCPHMMVMS